MLLSIDEHFINIRGQWHMKFRIFLLLLLCGCHDTGTAPISSDLQLSAQDVVVKEVWLHVQVGREFVGQGTLTLTRNDVVISSIINPPSDTMLLDANLLPKHHYIYRVKLSLNILDAPTSEPLAVTTLDTTGNNFSWQAFTFGSGGTCSLSDVTIISDTDIWAVGEVFVDSADGNHDPLPFNLLHWNGQSWSIQKIPYNYQGQAVLQPFANGRIMRRSRSHFI